ncbi:MAG: hypothetical protein WKF40_05740 [Thermoleophilaceae bacterium]
MAPALAPGLSDATEAGMERRAALATALAEGELSTLVLLNADPRRLSRAGAWSPRGLRKLRDRRGRVPHPGLEEHATVVFPSESGAEREHASTHPDGRIQRVRQAIGHQGEVLRPGWRVLAELAERCDAGLGLLTTPQVFAEMVGATPFWTASQLKEIRWPRRALGRPRLGLEAWGPPSFPDTALEQPPELPEGLRLGAVPSLWAGPVSEHAPSLRFLDPRAARRSGRPADARRARGDLGRRGRESAPTGAACQRQVALRQGVQPGSVFLVAGTAHDNATALTTTARPARRGDRRRER